MAERCLDLYEKWRPARWRYQLIQWLAGSDPVIINMSFRNITLHAKGGPGLVARCTFRDVPGEPGGSPAIKMEA